MSSITDYLTQIQTLTNKNLEILQALNSAFYSNKHHVVAVVGNEKYVIPSFLTLENKLNSLQANFENLVDAPSTGEAYMTFDGNTQKMQMMGYSQTPHQVKLEPVENFLVQPNDVMKDLITPNVSVRLDITSIDNCTKTVNIKKVSAKSETFKQRLSQYFDEETQVSKPINYGEFKQIIANYEEDVDYTEYDSIKRLPIRNQIAQGEYKIQSVVSHAINDNFTELYTLVLDSVNYTVDSGTIIRTIQVGDELVTNRDNVKLKVLSVRPITKEVDIEVLYGGFAELGPESDGIEDMYKLHYFRSINFDETKYIDVPLEEDRFVVIFVSPVNDTTNTSASWGTGLMFDTFALIGEVDGEIWRFEDYYNQFVNNLGDTLYGITTMFSEIINNMTEDDFISLQNVIPQFDDSLIHVTQINKHLNDSETVKNIRKLYSQKSKYKQDLSTIQLEIDNINTQLASLDFDDTTDSRQLFTNRLAELNEQKSNLTASVSSLIREISQNVSDSDVPIENAKYHIRGFVPMPTEDNLPTSYKGIAKLDIEYRYKNRNRFTGTAETFGDNTFDTNVQYIYSDWNKMETIDNMKVTDWANGRFTFERKDQNNQGVNEISWNQLDIPITQGESVDIRARWIFDWCWPFAECRSNWSEIKTVDFPEEYLKNISVLDIVEENNEDAKKEQFNGLLRKEGVLEHVGDYVDDQNLRYFHKAAHIASGFYTDERKIVPLYDKLLMIDNLLGSLQTEVLGATTDNLQVTLFDDEHSQVIAPWASNIFHIQDYTTNFNKNGGESVIGLSNVVYKQITIDLYNAGAFTMKLFASFPGSNTADLLQNATGCNGMSADGYVYGTTSGSTQGVFWKNGNSSASAQKRNQWIYFRRYNVFDGDTEDGKYYNVTLPGQFDLTWTLSTTPGIHDKPAKSGQTCINSNGWISSSQDYGTFITAFPIDSNMIADTGSSSMSCQCPTGEKYITIKPGEHKQVLIGVWYNFLDGTNPAPTRTSTKLAFDLRTSLYTDPVNYEFTIETTKLPELPTREIRMQAQTVSTQTQQPYRMVILNTDNIANNTVSNSL